MSICLSYLRPSVPEAGVHGHPHEDLAQDELRAVERPGPERALGRKLMVCAADEGSRYILEFTWIKKSKSETWVVMTGVVATGIAPEFVVNRQTGHSLRPPPCSTTDHKYPCV